MTTVDIFSIVVGIVGILLTLETIKTERPIPKDVALRIVFKRGVQKNSEGSYEVEAYRGRFKLKRLRIKTPPQVSGNVLVESGNTFLFLWNKNIPPNSDGEYSEIKIKRFKLFGWVEEEITEDREIKLEYEGVVEWSYLNLLIARVKLFVITVTEWIKMKIRKISRGKLKISPKAAKIIKDSQKFFEQLLEGKVRVKIMRIEDSPLIIRMYPLIKNGKVLKGYPSRASVKIVYYPF